MIVVSKDREDDLHLERQLEHDQHHRARAPAPGFPGGPGGPPGGLAAARRPGGPPAGLPVVARPAGRRRPAG